jgi:CRISPR type I-D-associated protein Csc1
MKLYKYVIHLLDPMFYSREGLGSALAPPYLHATAVNCAVNYALSLDPELQPYIISDQDGGRNTPRYKNSLVSNGFYFTPGRLRGRLRYQPQVVKGDGDGFIALGYGAATGKSEVLKAYQIFEIPPEAEFEGYIFLKQEDIILPPLIRLGSFRGKAILKVFPVSIKGIAEEELVDHPVDPLVSDVTRGVMVNMFPYPVIENPVCRFTVRVAEEGSHFTKFISPPVEFENHFIKKEERHRPKEGMII